LEKSIDFGKINRFWKNQSILEESIENQSILEESIENQSILEESRRINRFWKNQSILEESIDFGRINRFRKNRFLTIFGHFDPVSQSYFCIFSSSGLLHGLFVSYPYFGGVLGRKNAFLKIFRFLGCGKKKCVFEIRWH